MYSYCPDYYADVALNQNEIALTDIQQDQLNKLRDLHDSHAQALRMTETSQQLEVTQLELSMEHQRSVTLQQNQLNHVVSATLSGVLVGAITNLSIALVSESVQIYYKKKQINPALRDIVYATFKGGVVGGVSGAVVALVETSAEIAAAGSLTRQLLKGNGALILTVGFFTVDIIKIIHKWYLKEISKEQLLASLTTTTSQFLSSNAMAFFACSIVAVITSTPLLLVLGWISGAIVGGYIGKKAGDFIDETWIYSPHSKLHEAYAILELPRNAPIEKVNKRFRSLALYYHPDRTMNLPDGEKEKCARKFFEINFALETIRNFHVSQMWK